MNEERRQRLRVYTLKFDNGPDQRIEAIDSTSAVAAREGDRLPYQITDESAVEAWLGPRIAARAAERSV